MNDPNPLGYGMTTLQIAARRLERTARRMADDLDRTAATLSMPALAADAAEMRARADDIAAALAEARPRQVQPAPPRLTRRDVRIMLALVITLFASLAALAASVVTCLLG